MTYVLGWKTLSNAYIAADSVITSARVATEDQSSFGERQICDSNVSVSERALKIVTDDDLAIGLCGDFQAAQDLASNLFRSYRRLRDPEAALREMRASNGPYPMTYDAKLVVAWKGKPHPRLFCFNQDGRGTVQEFGEGEGVPLGSVRAMHRSFTQDLFRRLYKVEANGSAAYLASALGVLQSFGVHDYMLAHGVGGSFTGLCVSSESITWQPDLLYLIDQPEQSLWDSVATCVRDDVLIVTSTMTNQARLFITGLRQDEAAHRLKNWNSFALSYIKSRSFDFVVCLGLQRWVVVVLEMRRQSESNLLRFNADDNPNDPVSWFELRGSVVSALRRGFAEAPEPDERDFRFGFEPYRPPQRRDEGK